MNLNCFSCGKEISVPDKVGYRLECVHCQADLHVCKNCRFYDPSVYNECAETSAERIREKERANFCDFFEARGVGSGVAGVAGTAGSAKSVDLKSAAEDLFKKK